MATRGCIRKRGVDDGARAVMRRAKTGGECFGLRRRSRGRDDATKARESAVATGMGFRVRGLFREDARRARTREGDAKPSRRVGGIDGVLVRDAV
jgi:hypothetical protein